MSEAPKKCMICAKPNVELRAGICNPCQDRIRREALGEQDRIADRAEREISRQGIAPTKK
jgi:hypothetical protein